MALDIVSPRSRRALLAGALGGAATLLAQALGRPLAAQATEGDILHAGDVLSATSETGVVSFGTLGLIGETPNHAGTGVYGVATATSGTTYGVYGSSHSSHGIGTAGLATKRATGMYGYSGLLPLPGAPTRTGVFGAAKGGRGGVFKGSVAPLKLVASTKITHPASGQKGDLFVDKSGRLWFCKGGTTWHRLA